MGSDDSREVDFSTGGTFGSQIGQLLLLAAIFFLNFLARIMLAPLMPTIEADLGVGHAEAGSLFLVISAGYLAAMLGAGFISSKLLHRRTIILSATAVGLSLVGIALSESFLEIRLALVGLGLAAGLYLPSGIAALTSLVDSRHWGRALAVHELAPNLGFVAAPLIAESLMHWFSWRGVLALMGGASALAGISFGFFGKGGRFPGESPSFLSFRALFTEPAFWIMILLFSLGIGGSLGVYTMLPLYLVSERHMERAWANTLVALSRISGLVMAFVAGWATDRLGTGRVMAGVFLFSGMATVLLGVVPGSWIVLVVFLQPMLAVCFFPAGLAALSSIGPTRSRNLTISLTIPAAFLLGGGAIPTAIGVMGDAGSFGLGIVLTGVLILLGFVLSLRLRLPGGSGE